MAIDKKHGDLQITARVVAINPDATLIQNNLSLVIDEVIFGGVEADMRVLNSGLVTTLTNSSLALYNSKFAIPTTSAPTAPRTVAATSGSTVATVTFTAPLSTGNSAITGYTVVSTPAGGVDTNAGATGLSHAITGLTNGVAYTFKVTATNAVGTSPTSAASNTVTPA